MRILIARAAFAFTLAVAAIFIAPGRAHSESAHLQVPALHRHI